MIAFLFFLSILLSVDACHASDEALCPSGFRGLSFGSTVPTSGVQMTRTEAGVAGVRAYPRYVYEEMPHVKVDWYRRETDQMNIGSSRLDKIEYGYWNGKLWAVRIEASGRGFDESKPSWGDCLYLKGACSQQWGSPEDVRIVT